MKKILIFIFSLLFLIGCTTRPSLKLEYPDNIDLKITDEEGLIELQLDKEQAQEFVDQVNNLEITECIPKVEDPINSWNLYARGLDGDEQEVFQISFIGNLINYNDNYFQTDQEKLEKIINSYK